MIPAATGGRADEAGRPDVADVPPPGPRALAAGPAVAAAVATRPRPVRTRAVAVALVTLVGVLVPSGVNPT